MGFLKTLFDESHRDKHADEIKKKRSKGYLGKWLRIFKFLSFPMDEQLRKYLIRTIEISKPQ